jgi:hypothetical protein
VSEPKREKRKGQKKARKKVREPLPVIGWREWVALPGLGVARVKAKIDTGARSSSLHAFNLREIERDGARWVRFKVHPLQRDTTLTVTCEAELLEWRTVRSSTGVEELRPVIVTDVELLGRRWAIELSLTRRDEMGFRMLLGRQAVRRRFLIDSGGSFKGGRMPPPVHGGEP